MKTWTLRFRQVDRKNFEELRSGEKAVETRAASVKYQNIAVGDILTFVCGKEKFSKVIKKKEHYQSIDAMLKKIPFKKINPDVKSVADLKKMYFSYPGYDEKIKEFGIFAFELE